MLSSDEQGLLSQEEGESLATSELFLLHSVSTFSSFCTASSWRSSRFSEDAVDVEKTGGPLKSKNTTKIEILSIERCSIARSTSLFAEVSRVPSLMHVRTNCTASKGSTVSHNPSHARMRNSSSPMDLMRIE